MADAAAPRRRNPLLPAAGVVLLALGGWQLGAAGAIHAKAWLAQVLLARAWADTLDGAGPRRPWPWADTVPVARLRVPELKVDQIVLSGASGRTLAFGPGHLDGTAAPGAPGHSVVSGHRDTQFRFLRDLRPGMVLQVQRGDGQWQAYRVRGSEVIDARHARLSPATERPALTLVTCYPFDAIAPGGPLRYLVFTEAAAAEPPNGANRGPGLPPHQRRAQSGVATSPG